MVMKLIKTTGYYILYFICGIFIAMWLCVAMSVYNDYKEKQEYQDINY